MVKITFTTGQLIWKTARNMRNFSTKSSLGFPNGQPGKSMLKCVTFALSTQGIAEKNRLINFGQLLSSESQQ